MKTREMIKKYHEYENIYPPYIELAAIIASEQYSLFNDGKLIQFVIEDDTGEKAKKVIELISKIKDGK